MRSEQKNLLYYLTGNNTGYINRTLSLGYNRVATEFVANRYKTPLDIYTPFDSASVKKHFSKLKESLPEKEINLITKLDRRKYSLCIIHLTLDYLSKLGISPKNVCDICSKFKIRNVLLVVTNDSISGETSEMYKSAFQEYGYSLKMYGGIYRESIQMDKYPKDRFFIGYLFSR